MNAHEALTKAAEICEEKAKHYGASAAACAYYDAAKRFRALAASLPSNTPSIDETLKYFLPPVSRMGGTNPGKWHCGSQSKPAASARGKASK